MATMSCGHDRSEQDTVLVCHGCELDDHNANVVEATRIERERCLKIVEGSIPLPLEAWRGTMKEHGAALATEMARLIRKG